MDELFDRAFNKAHGTVHAVTGKATAAHDKQAAIASKEDALRTLTTPMTPKDAVERIHLAFKDGDYFRCSQVAAVASPSAQRIRQSSVACQQQRGQQSVQEAVYTGSPRQKPWARCKAGI
eukprot:GHRR01021481.1.p3 GENE.GHRR01021481.1~~GHRR01021481.1.p3  ORF type:complete len:120 (+),score=26.32 GHRR01021481.1:233-592(+)